MAAGQGRLVEIVLAALLEMAERAFPQALLGHLLQDPAAAVVEHGSLEHQAEAAALEAVEMEEREVVLQGLLEQPTLALAAVAADKILPEETVAPVWWLSKCPTP